MCLNYVRKFLPTMDVCKVNSVCSLCIKLWYEVRCKRFISGENKLESPSIFLFIPKNWMSSKLEMLGSYSLHMWLVRNNNGFEIDTDQFTPIFICRESVETTLNISTPLPLYLYRPRFLNCVSKFITTFLYTE